MREALEASSIIEFGEHPETLSPVDAAGSSSLHLGVIEPSGPPSGSPSGSSSGEPGSFWLRAVMDNLTTGGALNAIGIAEAVILSARAASGDGYTM